MLDDHISMETSYSYPALSRVYVAQVLGWISGVLLLAGMFLTPPWLNIGLALGMVSVLLVPHDRRPPRELLLAGGLFALWQLFTVWLAVQRGQKGAGDIPGSTYHWLALPLMAVIARDERWRKPALGLVVLAGFIALGYATWQFVSGSLSVAGGTSFQYARGFAGWHITYGFVGAIFASVLISPLAGGMPWWVRLPGILMALIVVALSGSRGMVLACIAGVPLALALRGGWRWILGGIALGVALVLAFGLRFYLTDPVRFKSMGQAASTVAVVGSGQQAPPAGQSLGDGRFQIWTTSSDLVAEHPWVGVGGRKAFRLAYQEAWHERERTGRLVSGYEPEPPHAHNTFLAQVVEHGLPALALHIVLIGAALMLCWRHRRYDARPAVAAGCLLVTGLVGGFFEPVLIQSIPGIAFHAWLGFAVGMAFRYDDVVVSRPRESATA